MEETKRTINVKIADRNYTFSVDPIDEEIIRLAGKHINDRIDLYRKKFEYKDSQDAISFILLQYAIQLLKDQRNNPSKSLMKELESMDYQLGEYIKQL